MTGSPKLAPMAPTPNPPTIRPSQESLDRIAYEASLDEDSCCSFAEWANAGYLIKKGSRSVFRDILGVPQFTKEQVVKLHRR